MGKIYRKEYMDLLLAMMDKSIIKVVTGIRRCGKSTLLTMFQDHLIESGVDQKQIVSINFEDMAFVGLKNKFSLYKFLTEKLQPQKMTYIFLDEVQLVDEFQAVVDSLYIKQNVDLYITGSNAKMLSGELATMLTGRYIEIKMLPLSFKEYIAGSQHSTSISEKYKEYLSLSSFPYTIEIADNKQVVNDYLQSLYNTIILKDIVSRNNISNVIVLEDIIRFVFDNIGNTISSKKISNTLNSDGRKSDVKTVEKYLKALTDCYLLYRADRYDVKGKQYLKSLSKYYIADIGLRRVLLGNKATDVGHILENIVFLELYRRGYKVYIGKVGNSEVDFVAENMNGIEYFQVAATIRAPETKERELFPFASIKDNYPKTILTLDEDPDFNLNGIRIRNALSWLLE